MFEELTEIVNRDITTIRSIIKTNNYLRAKLFSKDTATQESLKNNPQLMDLKALLPDDTTWKVYEHCSVVTRLYSIYESFVEKLITGWINYLPEIYPDYSDLPETIRNTHSVGVGNLLLELRKEKSRLRDLSVEQVIRGLYLGITNQPEQYDLIAEAFIIHQQNLRKEAIEQLFTNAGIPQSWNWIKEHRKMKIIVEDIDNTAEGELKELIEYRNDAAHGGIVDNVLGEEKLLNLCNFIKSICEAFLELVNYHIIERQKEIGQVKDIGSITRWFPQQEAGRAKLKQASLSVGDNVWLISKTKSYCQLVEIESLRITTNAKEVNKNHINITSETEVGLKFNKNARKDLKIYKNIN